MKLLYSRMTLRNSYDKIVLHNANVQGSTTQINCKGAYNRVRASYHATMLCAEECVFITNVRAFDPAIKES